MISFRYHLVTIAAIFLALALGVLVGTTVVNQGVINELRTRTDTAAKTASDLRKQLGEVQAQLAVWSRFGGVIEPTIVQGRLSGTEVTIVTQQNVQAAEVAEVRRVLEDAGAVVGAELVVSGRMSLPDAGAVAQLQALLGLPVTASPSTTPSDDPALTAEAARQLAGRLAEGPSADPARGDVLDALVAGSFVTIRGGAGAAEIGGAGTATVVVAGGPEPPIVDPAAFLQPLVRGLVEAGRPVVAADTSATDPPERTVALVPLIRGDGALDGKLVTVDNADELPGRVAVVLGLRDLLLSPGQGGDYGWHGTDLVPKP